MKNKHHKNWGGYLFMVSMELLAGAIAILIVMVLLWTQLRLPQWISSVLFWVGIGGIMVFGSHLFRRKRLLSRAWVILIVSVILFFTGISLVYAGYIGSNRSTTTTSWERRRCSYLAVYDPPGPGYDSCTLTLHYPPTSSCPGSVGAWFNPAPTACGSSWPGTCGSGISCNISSTGNSVGGCSPGDSGCTETTSTTSLPPATVNGTTSCGVPGNSGWCRGGAALNLSGSEPLSGYSLTDFEGDPGTLCSAPSCTWAGYGEGVTTFNFWVHSTYGDTSNMSSATMRLDSLLPSISLSIPAPDGSNGWHVSPVTASVSGSDSNSGLASASINGGGSTFTPGADGTYDLTATVIDVAGNSASTSGTIHLDTTPPTPGLSIPAPDGSNDWYISPVTVSPNGSDATSGLANQEVSLDNTTWSSSLTTSTSGIHTVYQRFTDAAGNTSTATTSVQVDVAPPTVNVTIPPPGGNAGWYTTAPVAFSTSQTDSMSGIASTDYSLDGGAWQTAPPSIPEGAHTVQTRVVDLAGNTTITTTAVNVDTIPPDSNFVSPAERSTTVVRGTVSLTGLTSDANSGPSTGEISLDGGSSWQPMGIGTGGAWSTTWNTTTVKSGTYTILMRARDVAGNLESTAQITLVVSNDPPGASITKYWTVFGSAAVGFSRGSSPIKGASITVSDPKGRWPDYVVKYKASELPSRFIWTGRIGNGKVAYVGVYDVTVRVWDEVGNSGTAAGKVAIVLVPRNTPTELPTVTSEVPTATDTPLPAVVVEPSPTSMQVVIVMEPPAPVAPAPVEIPEVVERVILWPLIAFLTLLAALAASAIVDRRPRELRALARSLKATKEIQKNYQTYD
jgi:hypothetical protein